MKEQNESQKIIELTDEVMVSGKIAISSQYKLPAYLAIQVLLSFRLPDIFMKDASNFNDEFNKVVALIDESAKGAWRYQNWDDVLAMLNQYLAVTLENYVMIARMSRERKTVLSLLSQVSKSYALVNEWQKLLSDDSKIVMASLYADHAQWDDSLRCFQSVDNIFKFLHDSGISAWIRQAATLIKLHANDDVVTSEVLLAKHKQDAPYMRERALVLFYVDFDAFEFFMNESTSFEGKIWLNAYSCFHRSHFKDFRRSLTYLCQETNQDINYWELLIEMLVKISESLQKVDACSDITYEQILLSTMIFSCVDKMQLCPMSQLQSAKCAHFIAHANRQSTLDSPLYSELVEKMKNAREFCQGDETKQSILNMIMPILPQKAYGVGGNALFQRSASLNESTLQLMRVTSTVAGSNVRLPFHSMFQPSLARTPQVVQTQQAGQDTPQLCITDDSVNRLQN